MTRQDIGPMIRRVIAEHFGLPEVVDGMVIDGFLVSDGDLRTKLRAAIGFDLVVRFDTTVGEFIADMEEQFDRLHESRRQELEESF
jgi:hypothetical protein